MTHICTHKHSLFRYAIKTKHFLQAPVPPAEPPVHSESPRKLQQFVLSVACRWVCCFKKNCCNELFSWKVVVTQIKHLEANVRLTGSFWKLNLGQLFGWPWQLLGLAVHSRLGRGQNKWQKQTEQSARKNQRKIRGVPLARLAETPCRTNRRPRCTPCWTGIQLESGARKETGRFRDVKRCVATGDRTRVSGTSLLRHFR